MDYFDSGQVSDFSVRDVFESEVKTEIDELLNTETTPFAQETVTNMDLGTGLPSADMGLEITELQAWDHSFNQAVIDSGLNTSDIIVSSPNNILDFSPDKYGLDSSSNIFVNPQTGLPSTQTTLGGTHIHAHQVNLFVNSGTSQLQQRALLQQQGLNVPSNKREFDQPDSFSLQQFNHVSNGHNQRRREFTHYQIQNGQGQTLMSERKNGTHRLAVHSPSIKTARHQPYSGSKSHLKKSNISKAIKLEPGVKEKIFPKPCYSYSCLITMALKNSKAGCLPVSEIYHFMCENFPYFKTAKDGWKNSVRHNLSLNKCFAKVETPVSNAKTGKKGCLWAMNPEKAAKMEEEVHKSTKRDPNGIRMSMAKPEDFPKIEALSRLTHPKNLKNAIKVQQRQSSSSQKRASNPNSHVTNNSIKVSSAAVSLTTPKPAVRPVSLKRMNANVPLGQDLFHQDFGLLDSNLPPLDGDLGLQDELSSSLCYDTVEILPFDVPSTTSSINTTLASSFVDTSPYKDNSQLINSRILGLDTSPVTTLANTHFSVVDQPKQLAAFM